MQVLLNYHLADSEKQPNDSLIILACVIALVHYI